MYKKHSFKLLLTTLFFCSIFSTDAFSHQIDTVAIYSSLDEVKVSGSRVALDLGKSARMVTVLDSIAIKSLPVKTINDLLKYTIGVDVRQRGAYGVQTDISVRGGTFDQIAILLNGINISDPQTGHNAFNLPVDIEDVARVEILEGPAARVYGVSSLVGAINIVTKSSKSKEGMVKIESGSYGHLNSSARVNLSKNKVYGSLSAGYLRNDGFSKNSEGKLNSDISLYRFFGEGTYEEQTYKIKAQAGLLSSDFGANTFYSPKFDNQYEHVLKSYTSISAETEGKIKFKPSFYWNHSLDRFELFRGDASKVPFNHHQTNVWGLNLNSYIESCLGKTALGFEMRNEDIVSTNLGEPLHKPYKVNGWDAEYKKGLNRTNISIFLEHNIVLNWFTLSGGLATIKNTGNEEGFKLYPGVDASVRFSDNWKLYASYNTSFRMPTFTELYYSVGGHKADKNLKSEKMRSLEGGLKYSTTGISGVFSIYRQEGRDMIDWILDTSKGEEAEWTSLNHTKIVSVGEELSFNIEPCKFSRLSFWKSVNLGYSHLHQNKKLDKGQQSKYALEYLKHKVYAQTVFNYANFELSIAYRYMNREGSYERFDNKKTTGEIVSFKPYSLLDSRLSYKFRNFNFYVEATNILDVKYYDYGNVQQPGIIMRGGLIYRFKL